MVRVVIDTNVFVAALRSGGGASRQVLRRAIEGRVRPLFSNALWLEYEDVLARNLWTNETTATDREVVLASLAASGEWVKIYYAWRPNLRDEGDNHLIELAVAGGAHALITHNIRDFHGGELRFGNLKVLTPSQCLETFA